MQTNDEVSILDAAPARPLSSLQPGDTARVVSLHARGRIRQRLLEMGFIAGAELKVEKLAPLGDPMELVLKGYHLSLRREESRNIRVVVDAQERPC